MKRSWRQADTKLQARSQHETHGDLFQCCWIDSSCKWLVRVGPYTKTAHSIEEAIIHRGALRSRLRDRKSTAIAFRLLLKASQRPDEEWRTLSAHYEVSSHGRVRSRTTGKLLSPHKAGAYWVIHLTIALNKTYLVHRLVAMAFQPNPVNLPTVDHIDRNPDNNHKDNLKWASYKDQNVNRGLPDPKEMHRGFREIISRHPVTGEERRHGTVAAAARWLMDEGMTKARDYHGIASKLSAVANGTAKSAFGLHWAYPSVPDLPGEQWVSLEPQLVGGTPNCAVSTCGRVRTTHGRVSDGWTKPDGKRYVSISNRQYGYESLLSQAMVAASAELGAKKNV